MCVACPFFLVESKRGAVRKRRWVVFKCFQEVVARSGRVEFYVGYLRECAVVVRSFVDGVHCVVSEVRVVPVQEVFEKGEALRCGEGSREPDEDNGSRGWVEFVEGCLLSF